MKRKVICVVMGGGRGTRLYPLTKMRAKPAVPLAGKYRLVDIPISNCIHSGFNRIYVLTQFNTASLHHHIQDSYKFDPFGGGFVDILSAEQTADDENWYQGTADAVRHNFEHFHADDEDIFLILSGDHLCRMDFRPMLDGHRRMGADVTVASKPMPFARAESFGVMRVDHRLRVVEFLEKPKGINIDHFAIQPSLLPPGTSIPTEPSCLVNMGMYVFNKRVLWEALSDKSHTDFSRQVIPSLLSKARLYAFIFDGYWEDIGTIRTFFDANLRLADPSPPFDLFDAESTIFTHPRYLPASRMMQCQVDRAIIADGCSLEGSSIHRAVIGVRSTIRSGCSLENVVVMGQDEFETDADRARNRVQGIPDIGIGTDCVLRNAIIDKNARIGNRVHLNPAGIVQRFERGDITVRDGIVIVSKNGIVPDDTVLQPR